MASSIPKASRVSTQCRRQKRQETIHKVQSRLHLIHLDSKAVGLTRGELREKASDSFLRLEQQREYRSDGRYIAEGITSRRSDGFFNRIEVNWLRHEATVYDEKLTEYFNQTGVGIAVDIVREHIYGLISSAYPHLTEECARQLAQRRENAKYRYGTDVSLHS